jgi:hypothetical protein
MAKPNHSNGYILLHRKIMQNKFYGCEPFCRTMAWIDLLLLANHDDNTFYARGIQVNVKRGQTAYAVETLAAKWRWSRGKVNRFLNALKTEGQIDTQKTNVTTLITILNYSQYQTNGKANVKASSTPNGHQTDTNNKLSNNYKEKGRASAAPSGPPLRRVAP